MSDFMTGVELADAELLAGSSGSSTLAFAFAFGASLGGLAALFTG
jgi:hypothetical protein